MRVITGMRARLEAADGLAGTLAAGWDALELVRAVAVGCADRSDALFAAFMMASAAAADGRDVLGAAPSMPLDAAAETAPGEVAGDPGEVAGALAGLVAAVRERLLAFAAGAARAGDRSACAQAADAAGQAARLLAGDG